MNHIQVNTFVAGNSRKENTCNRDKLGSYASLFAFCFSGTVFTVNSPPSKVIVFISHKSYIGNSIVWKITGC